MYLPVLHLKHKGQTHSMQPLWQAFVSFELKQVKLQKKSKGHDEVRQMRSTTK